MFYNNSLYIEDLKTVINSLSLLEQLNGNKILVTGASGLIGSFLVDMLMFYNELVCGNIDVFAMGRERTSLEKRFRTHCGKANFHLVQHDVNFGLEGNNYFNYIIHAASNAYPRLFSEDPVGTIMGNILGAYNLLEYARQSGNKRFLYISSGEVYGQGTQEISEFVESFCGYVDNTNPRSCYPNGKRAAETLCVSYTKQFNIDSVIVRPCHIYGPTATPNDNRASAQFINNVLAGKDIVMKSPGMQLRSYCYVADCVSAILTILLHGKTGNAYNIANLDSNVTIREIAEIIADLSGKKVLLEIPNETEKASYNPVTQSVLDAGKLECLGWKGKFNIKKGLQRTIEILRASRMM
jgi:UDP-glucuronate decarboxylase